MKQKKPIFRDQEERSRFKDMIATRIAHSKKLIKDRKEDISNGLIEDIFGRGIIEIDIRIPLIKNGRQFFNLRESVLLAAEKEHKLIRLNAPDGSRLIEPKEWRTESKVLYQKFNYGTPMKLIGNFIFKE